MTVCIAAACDHGRRIVTANDSLLSMGDVTGECLPAKMVCYGDWLFMYAGTPANFGMVSQEISEIAVKDTEALSRRRVQETVRRTYRKVYSRLCSFDVLNPFDMTMEEFKKVGLKSFGEGFQGELLRRISQKASFIYDQLLVTGWGPSPNSAMIYEVGPSGDCLHEAAGFTAIGSGWQMAQTMLLQLGQARHRTLAETIFNVACAKFSSEKSSDLDVGRMTTIYVSRKRTDKDDPDQPCGEFVSLEDIAKLRDLWESHLKPRIPDEARAAISGIAARVNSGETSARDMAESLYATQRIAKKRVVVNSEDSPNPQSTTADPSAPPPSLE